MNKLMNKVRKNKKGFTLIELIVVIAILGILVLLAAPRFLGYTKDAKVATMQADAKVLANAALIYNIEHEGEWPVEDETVVATITQGEGEGAKEINVVALDKEKLSDHVQSLKGEFTDYGIVIEKGSNQGSVYHIAKDKDGKFVHGVEGRNGDKHYGVDLVDKAFAEDGKTKVTDDDITVTAPMVLT